MHTDIKANSSPARNACCAPRSRRPQWLRLTVLAAGIACGASSQAIEFGPFKLTGFAKAEFTRVTPYCPASYCQVADPRFTVREFQWADAIASGKSYGPGTTHVTLFQPWLEAKFDIGRGFKLSGLLSQRYRDGKIDLPGFVYEKNVAISHEDYGRLAVGAMTSRSWSVADYPYGTNIGLADVWGSSGAGYGLLGHALRYTSRIFDVLEGDLVLEATYDRGNRDFKIHKPWFYELYAQFHKGDLVIDGCTRTRATVAPWPGVTRHSPVRSTTSPPTRRSGRRARPWPWPWHVTRSTRASRSPAASAITAGAACPR